MKKQRKIATNWALIALVATTILIFILNLFGIEKKPLYDGMTTISGNGIPQIGIQSILIFIPLMVFSLKYLFFIYKDKKDFKFEIIGGIIYGIIFGSIAIDDGSFETFSGAINVTVGGTILAIALAILFLEFTTVCGTFFSVISSTISATLQFFFFGLTNYSLIEGLIIGIASFLPIFILNMMSVSIIYLTIGLFEKFFSKEFWLKIILLFKDEEKELKT